MREETVLFFFDKQDKVAGSLASTGINGDSGDKRAACLARTDEARVAVSEAYKAMTRRMRAIVQATICAALCLTLTPLAADPAADNGAASGEQTRGGSQEAQYTDAQLLLFSTPHLENIVSTSQLHYDVSQTGSLTQTLTDQIVLSITAINENGGKDVQPQFLSSKKEQKFGAVKGFRGNPLLLYFLEWDIDKLHDNRNMNLNKIHRQYFQSIIRNAFRHGTVEAGTVSHNGKPLAVRTIRMQPMVSLKDNPKYQHMWNKQYEFVLADVPGGIYRISTEIPGDKPDAPPKERLEITFSRVTPENAYRAVKHSP